ncbi:flagellar [Chlorella sorokiniana]|uniref:Flagellar n=1 Tax=Chlorella sorokiniana TaxID=3076 RepID=A0A2P6U1J6_CHLSO|nr:flagellar [Chlorella sorokiniana]|eukprot:PRW60190.1 flagellar [Chlorella sorokiniana]
MSLPGYERLELSGVLDATSAQLVQLVIDAVKSGKKKVKIEVEVEGKLSEDGKSVELEIEIEAKEGDRKESRELEYSVPL